MLNYLLIPLAIVIFLFLRAIYVRNHIIEEDVAPQSHSILEKTIDHPQVKDIQPSLTMLIEAGEGTIVFSLSDTDWVQVMLLSSEEKTFAVCYGKAPDTESLYFSNSPKTFSEIEEVIKYSIGGQWHWIDHYNDWVHDQV